MFPATKEFEVYKDAAREKSKIPKPPLRTPSKTPAKPTEDTHRDRKPLSVVHRASANSNKKSTPPSAAGKPQQRSSPAGNETSPVTTSPSLCSECTRAASQGAVCFIGNDGRVSACSTRSAIRLCKNLSCAASNPDYVNEMANAPKKYLISKRHQLKAQYAPKQKLVQPKSPKLGNNTINVGSVDGLLTPVKSTSPSKCNRKSDSKNECRISSSSNDEIPALCVALSPNAKALDQFHDDLLSHSSPFHDAMQSPCDDMLTLSDCDYSFLGVYQDAELKTLEGYTTPSSVNLRRAVDFNSVQIESHSYGNGDDEVYSTPIQDLPRDNEDGTQYDNHIHSVDDQSPKMESQSGCGDILIAASCESNGGEIGDDSQVSDDAKCLEQESPNETQTIEQSSPIESTFNDVVVESVCEETTTCFNHPPDNTALSEDEIITSCMELMKGDNKCADNLTKDDLGVIDEVSHVRMEIQPCDMVLEIDASIMVDPVDYFDSPVEEHTNIAVTTVEHQNIITDSAHDGELESSQYTRNGTLNTEVDVGGDIAVNETLETEPGLEEAEDYAVNPVNGTLENEFDDYEAEDYSDNGDRNYIEYSNTDVYGTPVCTENANNGSTKKPNKRPNGSHQRRVLKVIEQQCPETVTLRKQQMLERRLAEEWMLNHAIEEVVQKLNPTGETKVKVLVEAFERIMSSPDVTESVSKESIVSSS